MNDFSQIPSLADATHSHQNHVQHTELGVEAFRPITVPYSDAIYCSSNVVLIGTMASIRL